MHYKFSYEDIASLIQQAQHFIEKVSLMPIPSAPVVLSSSVTWLTQLTDIWLVHALHKYPVSGLNVVSVEIHLCFCAWQLGCTLLATITYYKPTGCIWFNIAMV